MLQHHKTPILLVTAVLTLGLIFAGLAHTSVVNAQGPGQGTPYPGQGMPCGGQGHMMGGRDGMHGQRSGSGQNMPWCGNGYMGGSGMMSGWGNMMGGWTPPATLVTAGQPLTLDTAITVANAYLASWGYNSTLKLGEVMQFTQNFYAQAVEISTGRGAFEFLIDPTNGTVWPEPGPNMMWNLHYGMMHDHMDFSSNNANYGQTMPVSSDQAHQLAQAFLDTTSPGTKISEDATVFYGYYTMDFSRDGNEVGMLSVNGYTGQVWLHTWHGGFVKETSPSQ